MKNAFGSRWLWAILALGSVVAGYARAATLQYAATGGAPHVELAGATVSGKINVRVNPCAAPGVKMYLDKVFKNVEGGCPYDYGGDNFLIDTAALADGAHTIEAREGDTVTVRAKAVFTVANTAPTTCAPPQPTTDTQIAPCAPPRIGGWTQTRSYSCVAPNWIPGPWAPAIPPGTACYSSLPPMRVAVTPAVAKFTAPAGSPITITWTASDPSAICVTDFPGAPGGNPGSTSLTLPAPAITTVVYRIGCTRAADGEVGQYFVTLQGQPPVLPALVDTPPACYPTELGCGWAESPDGNVKVWPIDGANVVTFYRVARNPGVYPMCLDNFTLTHANADRQWARCHVPMNAADAATADALEQKFLPRFTAVGGLVYVSNSDNTLGPPLMNESAAVTVIAGTRCQIGQKITVGGKRYQRVWHAPTDTGPVQPFNAFAECIRQDAPVGGWLN